MQQQQLTKLRIDADCLLRVLECLGKRDELGVCKRTIIVPTRVAGVALDTLRIALHCPGKVALLEQPVALLACFGGQRRVDVSRAVCGCFNSFDLLEFVEDVRCAVLRERLLEEANRVGQVFLFGIGRAYATVRFRSELIVCAELGGSMS